MKQIYVKAYLKKNLGDDLFLKILVDRYPACKFLVMTSEDYRNMKFDNLIIKKRKRMMNKILKIVTNNKKNQEQKYVKESDITVLIGGSLFIQRDKEDEGREDDCGDNYYILGSNFGPYKTKEYYDTFYHLFQHAKDVCFRETYSYELFQDLENVRVAPDIIFSMDTSKIANRNTKKVVISVVDADKKVGEGFKKDYEEKIHDLIHYFIEKEYEVCMMSFCKDEGDEEAIASILSKCSETEKEKITTYDYTGNIDEALNVMADSQIIIGTRFHANILGLLLHKTIIPIAYSDKTMHVLEDIDFQGRIIDLRKIKEFQVEDLTKEEITYKIDVEKQIQEAGKHFEKLDEEIKKG